MILIIILVIVEGVSYKQKYLPWQKLEYSVSISHILPLEIPHNVYHGTITAAEPQNPCKFKPTSLMPSEIYSRPIQQAQQILSIAMKSNMISFLIKNEKNGTFNLFTKQQNNQVYEYNLQHYVLVDKINLEYIAIGFQNQMIVFNGHEYWITETGTLKHSSFNRTEYYNVVNYDILADQYIVVLYTYEIQIFDSEFKIIVQYPMPLQLLDVACEKIGEQLVVFVLTKTSILVYRLFQNSLVQHDRIYLVPYEMKKLEILNSRIYVVATQSELYDFVIKIYYSFAKKAISIEKYFTKNEVVQDIYSVDSSFSVLVGDYLHRLVKTDLEKKRDYKHNSSVLLNNLNNDLILWRETYQLKVASQSNTTFSILGYNDTHVFQEVYQILPATVECKSQSTEPSNIRIELFSTFCDNPSEVEDCKTEQEFFLKFNKQHNSWQIFLIYLGEVIGFAVVSSLIGYVFYRKIKKSKQQYARLCGEIELMKNTEIMQIAGTQTSPKSRKLTNQQRAPSLMSEQQV